MEDRSFGNLTWLQAKLYLDLGLNPSLFLPSLCLFILLDQLLEPHPPKHLLGSYLAGRHR